MSKRIKTLTPYLLSLFLVPALSSCSSTNSDRATLKVPSYAQISGAEDYSVRCDFREIEIRGKAKEIFYNEDGSFLTHKEFCEKHNSGTHIKP